MSAIGLKPTASDSVVCGVSECRTWGRRVDIMLPRRSLAPLLPHIVLPDVSQDSSQQASEARRRQEASPAAGARGHIRWHRRQKRRQSRSQCHGELHCKKMLRARTLEGRGASRCKMLHVYPANISALVPTSWHDPPEGDPYLPVCHCNRCNGRLA